MYRNDCGLSFTDVTTTHLPALEGGTRAVALADIDGDGELDLVFGNERLSSWSAQDWLFLNDGTGRFTDTTSSTLPVDTDNAYALAFIDFDQDGDLDLVVGNGGPDRGLEQNRLYRNDGSGRFTDATPLGLPVLKSRTTALAAADVDQDGDSDAEAGPANDECARSR